MKEVSIGTQSTKTVAPDMGRPPGNEEPGPINVTPPTGQDTSVWPPRSTRAGDRPLRGAQVPLAERAQAAQGRSGYAKDVSPGSVDAEEARGLAVPVSNGSKQEGVPTPAERTYGATYEAVDAAEAIKRSDDRKRGKLPQIANGLTDQTAAAADLARASGTDFDPLSDNRPLSIDEALQAPPDQATLDAARTLLEPVVKAAGAQQQPAPVVPSVPMPQYPTPPVAAPVPVLPDGYAQINAYLGRRGSVVLEGDFGIATLDAIDVIQSDYSVTILLPMVAGSSIFIPKPGSSVTVDTGERKWNCLYPGTSFRSTELEILGLTFIKQDETDGR